MSSFRSILTGLFIGLVALGAGPSVRAQSVEPLSPAEAGFTLRAAFGGAMPYARRESFVVATLAGPAAGRRLSLASTLPLSGLVRPVFDARPQYVLGADLGLAEIGGARLSLDGLISAGAEPPTGEERRPLLGLARLRLVF